MTRKLGRKPNDATKRRIVLDAEQLLSVPVVPPATVDYYSKVPAHTWGMDGNQAVGDCTCADVDHEVKSMQVVAGNPEVVSTEAQIVAAYSAITGYTPTNPNSDQGAEMQDVRNYWLKTGFRLGTSTDRILLFAELKPVSSTDLIKLALSRFGAIGLGINFPASAMTQFDKGQPWDVVHGSQIEGGHAIALVGYDPDFWYVVTWGQVQKMTPAFFSRYVEEAWVALSSDFVNGVSGSDPFAETLYQLGEQFAEVTGKPNPVPVVDPTPVPAPTPVPTPAPVPPAPADDSVLLEPDIAARVDKAAARRHTDRAGWVNGNLRHYFGL